MSTLALALRLLRREWRAGELRLLSIALIIAVGSITSVGFFTDRIAQVLQRQANELLGADLLIASNRAVPAEFGAAAVSAGLRTARTVSFLSMTLAGERNQLAEIKAVSPAYPLRGRLQIAPEAFGTARVTTGVPQPGTAWLDAQLLHQLGLRVGEVLELGAARLRVAAVLTQEPDRRGDFFSIAPRLLMNIRDVAQTELIQVGSRVQYRLLVAGEAENVQAYRTDVEPRLAPGQSLEGVEDARPEVRAALDRAQRFLGLAALVSVLLAGVAVASSARRFTLRHRDSCAIMRCFGAAQGQITRIYLYQMVYLGLAASVLGCALGYAAQSLLADVLGNLVAADLPFPSLVPAIFGLGVGMVMLLGFAVPPLLALKNVPTLRVLRRDIELLQPRSLWAYALGLILLASLMLWQAGDPKLGFYLIGGTLATIAVLAAVAYALVGLLGVLREGSGAAWRFGLANIARRKGSSITQLLALGVGIMALLLLTLVRGDLLASWQDTLPAQAPNRFIINIQPEQVAPLRMFFQNARLAPPELYPMIRGRLVEIDGQPVAPGDYGDARSERLAEREFNLSFAPVLPRSNPIVAGQAWTANDLAKNLFSVEEGIAASLGIELGDSLTFSVAGEELSATVSNLRRVDWDSFQVNFFVIATPRVLQDYPASYVTSFYLPTTGASLLSDLVKAFPNITIIDVAAIMAQVRRIIERVTLAVEYVFIFTVLAGLLVLYAAIQSTQDERIHESAILRTLGASRRQLLQGVVSEFVTLGVLSGLVASLAASVVAYILAERVLHLPYTFNPWLWLVGITLGALVVGGVGALSLRPILRQPPLSTLRAI